MRSRAISLAGRFVLAVLFASAPALHAAAQEARCSALGSDCFCSEPLNVSTAQQGTVGDVDDNNGSDLNVDPPDTNTKECHPSGKVIRFLTGGEGAFISAANVGLPSTHSLTSVFEIISHQGGAIRHDQGSAAVLDVTNKTFCNRVYIREQPGMPEAPGGDDDHKVMQLGDVSDGFIMDEDGGYKVRLGDKNNGKWVYPNTNIRDSNVEPGKNDDLRVADCSTAGWCVMEMCVDHNWDGTNHQRVRTRMRSLGNGKEVGLWADSSNTYGSSTLEGRRLLRRFRVECADDGKGCSPGQELNKYRRTSHLMAAMVPANPNFWIGPAVEIEGGSGGPPPPPPPPPAAPQAPVLR